MNTVIIIGLTLIRGAYFNILLIICVSSYGQIHDAMASSRQDGYLSPATMLASKDGKTLFVACATGNRVLCFDNTTRKVIGGIPMPDTPSGLALSPDGRHLFVTSAASESKVCVVDPTRRKIVERIAVSHTASAPVVGLDGKMLYVCNQFNSDVSVINLPSDLEVCRIAVRREPVAAGITKDGKYLLVANHLNARRTDMDDAAAVVSVIDLAARKVVAELRLPSGSGILKDIQVSPDGKFAMLTHIVANFNRPTSRVDFGWMNANAMTVIDLGEMKIRSTFLLDEPNSGAANPWGVAWSEDGKILVVTHAGTHEVSIIDFPALLAALPMEPGTKVSNPVLTYVLKYEGVDPGLPFLTGARRRVKLPLGDFGPRSVAVIGHTAYVANYFSDTLSVIDLSDPKAKPISIPLGPKPEMSVIRKGEFYFNDATICLQGWQSCASCHPGDARVDGLNWDLLNDGSGNPKSTKSLLLAHKRPPVMSLGVRADAEAAVRAGIKFILFTNQPESVAVAIDEYLKSLKPMPSPYLVHGQLSVAAKRGKKVYLAAGCAECHPPGLYTDLRPHEVGTRAGFDQPKDEFYTPTLIEVWRTAPYLHDGSAVTIREVLTTRNPRDEHGTTTNLSSQEMDDLCAYVLSL